jgi:glyoxylase-like metal-dependent hydrolase (beta-lactamase superfamily II)
MSSDPPADNSATWSLLSAGYVEGGVAGTVVLVVEGDLVAVVDPGMVADRSRILDPLAAAGYDPSDVTDVVLSHHHPDHTLNAALFRSARVHDFQAVYRDDQWERRAADGVLLSPSVRLLHVPGHTPQDIATVIATKDGVAVCTHAWWSEAGPADDPYAPDRNQLRRARERVLALADVIVPGHGQPFVPTDDLAV